MTWYIYTAVVLACLAIIIIITTKLAKARFGSWPANSVSATNVNNNKNELDFAPQSGKKRRRHALIVIAHPDDEAMFFVPAIIAMRSSFDFSILCCSTGNYNNLGAVRASELVASGVSLGFSPERMAVVDRKELSDGMQSVWDSGLVSSLVREYTRRHAVDTVLTFDAGGISGHPNHISVWQGVATFAAENGSGGNGGAADAEDGEMTMSSSSSSGGGRAEGGAAVVCYSLDTVPMYRKFLGPLDVCISWALHSLRGGNDRNGRRRKGGGGGGGTTTTELSHHQQQQQQQQPPTHVLLVGGWNSMAASHIAMQKHYSQYVWFRRLFVVFSRYTTVNSLTKL